MEFGKKTVFILCVNLFIITSVRGTSLAFGKFENFEKNARNRQIEKTLRVHEN